jgi:hypothetical protein
MIGSRVIKIFSAIFLVTIMTGYSADFGMMTKHLATVELHRPPVIPLPGRTMSIKSANRGAPALLQNLELVIGQAFATEAAIVDTQSDAVLTFLISGYNVPKIDKYQNRETRMQMSPNGATTQRIVTVGYWEGSGAMDVQVDLKDSHGNILDNKYVFHAEYYKKYQLSINGIAEFRDVSSGASNNQILGFLQGATKAPSNSASKPFAEPTVGVIDAELVHNIAGQIKRRYTQSVISTNVYLAVPEYLRRGNLKAMSGNWEEALAIWKTAVLPGGKKDEGEKDYNMALANEVLFYNKHYSSGDITLAEPFYLEAKRLYQIAYQKDPNEKKYSESIKAFAAADDDYNRAKEQAAAQTVKMTTIIKEGTIKKETRKAEDQYNQEVAREMTRPVSKDSASEASFRSLVRTRLHGLNQKPAEEYISRLEKDGTVAYSLKRAAAARVVSQEIQDLDKYYGKVETYKNTLTDFIGRDKLIDAKERAALSDLSRTLGFNQEEVSALEAEFQFSEAPRPKKTARGVQ